MSNWDKDLFIDHMREQCNREIAKVGVMIIEFTEKHSDDVSWGRGSDHGTLTFRCDTDVGTIPLFHMTSTGQLNLQINFMRNKEIPPMVLRDVVLKLEANFLRDYDDLEYPKLFLLQLWGDLPFGRHVYHNFYFQILLLSI